MTELTKERLVRELAEARAEVIAAGRRAGEAAKHGDLRENSAYEQARDEQDLARVKVLELRRILLKPQLIHPRTETDTIDLGNKVTLQYDDGSTFALNVLGSEDGGTKDDWLSCETPLAKAIIGKKIGDVVTLESGKVTILKVEPGDFE